MPSPKPIRGDYLFINYLANYREVRPHHLSNLRIQCIKSSVFGLAYLCNIDICATSRGPRPEREPSKWWRPQLFGLKYFKHSDWWQRQRYTWLTDVVLLLYLLLNFQLGLNLYYQYSLDFDKLRLMRLQAMLRQGLVSGPEFERLAVTLFERIDETSETLSAIGAPHRHMSMAIECFHLYVLLFAFIIYYCSYLFYRIFTLFDFHFVRELLEPEEEQRRSERLIESKVTCFMGSSKVFASLYHSQLLNTCGASNGARFSIPFLSRVSPTSEYLESASASSRGSKASKACEPRQGDEPSRWPSHRDQRAINDTLRRMHQSGALRPYNKSLDALKRRNKHLFIGFAFLSAFSLFFFPTLIEGSLARRDFSTAFTWSDLATISALFGLIFILCAASTLMASLFFTTSLDQAVMVNKIRELVLECILQNKYEFQQLNANMELYAALRFHQGHKTDPSRAAQAKMNRNIEASIKVSVHKMNANFLFILMQYKIFLAQYQSARRSIRAAVPFIISLTMLIPLIIKLHLPYLQMFNFNNVKWFAVAMSPVVLLPSNFVLVPICHLDSRFMNLYRALCSLIAHITEIESHPNGHGIHDEHAVALLLKEIRHTYQFKDRSDSKVAGVAATYTTLVKTHFWLGIVALSILADNQEYSGNGLLSTSFFADPFGIFSTSNLLEIQ